MKTKRLYTIALCSLCCIQAAIILLSWIVGALLPECNIRNMLSGEAIRWFCGHFVEFCSSPVLVWILLLSMSFGTCRASGILRLRIPDIANVRHIRSAVIAASLAGVACIFAVCMLTLPSHAVLLSAVGTMFPSPFSVAIVPFVSLFVFIVSAVYGIASNNISSIHEITESLVSGVHLAAPLLILFIFAAMVVNSILYVLAL